MILSPVVFTLFACHTASALPRVPILIFLSTAYLPYCHTFPFPSQSGQGISPAASQCSHSTISGEKGVTVSPLPRHLGHSMVPVPLHRLHVSLIFRTAPYLKPCFLYRL